MNARIVLEFPHAPEAKALEQLIALAEKFNAIVVESPNSFKAGEKKQGKNEEQIGLSNQAMAFANGTTIRPLYLGIEKFPQNLDAYSVKPEHLDAFARVFEDEPNAEVLCEMLTA